MAFPFLFHENFELGTKGAFTSESDSLGKVDFPNKLDGLDVPPWRGGYVMQINLDRGTNDGYVQHDTAFAISGGTTRYMRLFIRLSEDFRMSPNAFLDFVRMYSGPSGGSEVSEVAFALTRQEYWYTLAIGSAEDTDHIYGLEIIPGQWTQVRIKIVHGQSSTGLVQMSVGRNSVQNMRVSMASTGLTHFRVGTMLQHPDVRGTLYIDDIVIDSDPLPEQRNIDASELSGESVLYTKTSYAFLGPGMLRGATLIGGASNNQAQFFDTDKLPYAYHNLKATLKVSSAETKDMLIESIFFQRGCYIVLTGTNPQVIAHYGQIGANLSVAA